MGLRHAPPYKIADLIPETTQRSIKLDEIRAPSHLPNPHEFPLNRAHKKGQGDAGRSRKRVCWPWRCSLPREPPSTSAPWSPWAKKASASDLGFSKACSVRCLFFLALIWPTGIAEILMFAPLHTPIVAIVVGQEVEYPTVLGHISNVNVISCANNQSFSMIPHQLSSLIFNVYHHL